MASDEEILTVDCPSCHAIPYQECRDRSDVQTATHVARRRRWRIQNEGK